jgi:SAM-dependent methyltransferase
MGSLATEIEQAARFWDGETQENPWGYGKRVRFATDAITRGFPGLEPASIRVLDVGCGNGWFLAIPLARQGFDVTGIDLHQASIVRARQLSDSLPNVRFVVGTVRELEAARFDVLILSEILEHVADPKELLLSTLEHLVPEGLVLVTVPNGRGEFEIDSWIFRTLHLQRAIEFGKLLFRRRSSGPSSSQQDIAATDNTECGHIQFFRLQRIRQLFADCSLTTVKEVAGCFLCGPLVCHTLGHSRRFIDWNVKITDKLPLTLASSWYFVLRHCRASLTGTE